MTEENVILSARLPLDAKGNPIEHLRREKVRIFFFSFVLILNYLYNFFSSRFLLTSHLNLPPSPPQFFISGRPWFVVLFFLLGLILL